MRSSPLFTNLVGGSERGILFRGVSLGIVGRLWGMNMPDETILAILTTRLGASVDASVPRALLVKIRAAERRLSRPVLTGYVVAVARNYLADVARRKVAAANAVAKAAVAKARELENERKACVFVQAADEFERLAGMDWVARLTNVQQQQLACLRLAVFDGISTAELAVKFGITTANAWQRICRGRNRLRPVATAMGFHALLEVVVNSTISKDGGVVGF